jgi:hypothetical protein
MKRVFGFSGVLGAGLCLCTAASAQTPLPPGERLVTIPVIINQGNAMVARPTADPQVVADPAAPPVNTAAPQPAPFRPAPVGTIIETTIDHRLVRTVNGYDVTYDMGNKRDTTHALLTDGFGGAQFYPPRDVEALWPLEVGKSTTFNVTAGGSRTVRARVLRTETITVPAGTFFTYVIERRDYGIDYGETIATNWYAPSVGAVVKFHEHSAWGRARPAYEVAAIVLPHVLSNAIPVTTPGDTPDRRAEFCRERGTVMDMPNGQRLLVDCLTFVQADLPAYQAWLQGRPRSPVDPVSLNPAPPLR